MQSFSVLGAIAAGAVFASGAAFAETGAQAPVKAASVVGVAWRCEGDACTGQARRPSAEEGLVRECRKVVAAIGPVNSYRSGERELSPAKVRACNRSAAGNQALRY